MNMEQIHSRNWLHRSLVRWSSQDLFGWVLAIPTLIAVCGIVLVPFVDSLVLSFHRRDLARPQFDAFIGLENYERLIRDERFLNSLKATATFSLVSVGFELVFCVNHLGPFLLTYLLLERLRQSKPARVIQVNSEGHRFGGLDLDDLDWKRRRYKGLKGYGASKIAQLLTVWEFADRLKGTGVTINAMHPGDVRTNIGNNNGPLYRWWLHNVTWHALKDPVISGEALYYLAAAPELAGVSGRFFHLTIDEKPAAHVLDREMGRRVWDMSLQMTGLGPGS